MSLSIAILTRNEEANLPECIASVPGRRDIVVVDSFSTDGTADAARRAGARVVQRPFDTFADQRNFALDQVDFPSPWVFFLDADERFTPALMDECLALIARDEASGGLVAGRLMFQGRWLRHAAEYPVYQMRLVKRGEVRFAQAGHGQRETPSLRPLARLRESYLHFGFSKGLVEWRERHTRYAREDAQHEREMERAPVQWAALTSPDPLLRRRAQQSLRARLPLRPLIRFLHLYIFRRGFLDGAPGLAYCRLMSKYEAMILAEKRAWRAGTATPGETP